MLKELERARSDPPDEDELAWARSLAVGRFFTCAKKLDQSIWCTGENVVGQLGVGDTDRRNVFTPIELP